MAALLYKDFLIIATGQFDKDKELWMPIADMSWHSATGRESQSHPARRASISEHQNFLDKVKQRNELIQEKTGQPFSIDINDPTLTQPGQLNTLPSTARVASQKRI